MTMHSTISATKANRLYWLGRYTERVYLELHLLRRYYDKMIDGEPEEYKEYYEKLEIMNPYEDEESFRLGYLYDEKNPVSIISGLTYANDNAIVLREEIKSETMSYIQMSLVKINQESKAREYNITNLQSITDWLLAFWGSIDERIFDERVKNLLKIGRYVELLDILIRFEYPYFRVRESFDSLLQCSKMEEGAFDKTLMGNLDWLIESNVYKTDDPEYKAKILKYLNHLVLV